jgi:pyruvate ferredoxin oxidoreductase gamma subunit/2-oxoisovalerate ferredoxin oxidoreductase gamma subunit
MQEIRFHGRGGQGTVVASILLAKAFFKAGYDVQTFPLFGVERRGAPVVDVTRGLKPGGWILLNTPNPPERLDAFSGYRLAFVDATQIAVKCDLGTRTHPIINTAMIGAFARMMGMPPLDIISEAIQAEITTKPDDNIQASKEAYEQVNFMESD